MKQVTMYDKTNKLNQNSIELFNYYLKHLGTFDNQVLIDVNAQLNAIKDLIIDMQKSITKRII